MTETTIDGQTGDLMTVEDFIVACDGGILINSDGYGDYVKGGKIVTPKNRGIKPAGRHLIPEDVTHILWYNR